MDAQGAPQGEEMKRLDDWYRQQPDRRCVTCGVLKPARDFGYSAVVGDLPVLHQRCTSCHHQAMLERRQAPCCLCAQSTPRAQFLDHFQGYRLEGGGTAVSLCCHSCEPAFLALPPEQQRQFIRGACDRTFPAGQVIYTLRDPETQAIRSIGRTNQPAVRYKEHLRERSATRSLWPQTGQEWYTRSNWMHDPFEKRLQPTMTVLHSIERAPLVVEWERRYLCHGIQHGWPLLNYELMDGRFVARARATPVDVLAAPFETVVEAGIFAPRGLEAFIRTWYG